MSKESRRSTYAILAFCIWGVCVFVSVALWGKHVWGQPLKNLDAKRIAGDVTAIDAD